MLKNSITQLGAKERAYSLDETLILPFTKVK
jgi:hypothetical protein